MEGKINELSSSMYSKEQHDNLLHDLLHQLMEMPYSLMRKPRDRKTKLHTKPDKRFSVYSDGLSNDVPTVAIS